MKVKSPATRSKAENRAKVNIPKDFPWKVLFALTIDLGQYLDDSDVKKIADITRKRDVEALLSLSKEWGLQSMPPAGDDGLQQLKARYQLTALLKKYIFPGDRETLQARAIEKFYRAEEQCHFFNLEGWKKLAAEQEEWKLSAVSYAKGFLQKLLGVNLPEFEELTEWSRHGPGATLDTEKDMVSSYFKFEKWPYQCTSAVYGLAKSVIRNDDRWLGALEDDYRTRFNIPKHVLLDRKTFWHTVLEIVPGARIAFVPKNAETFRTITIEPTMNMYLQLGVDGYIRRRLKRWGINLDSQAKNQLLARIGSTGGEDPFVTIDLSSASDTVSRRLCEILLPDEWNSYLLKLRSPMCELEGDKIWFQKMSAMGNGFTFVLESAIFASLIYGVMMVTNGFYDRDAIAVFGDDLIVRRSLADRLISLLTDCGFTINQEKSFFEGPIRESCGCDWFEGKPIRPVFLKDAPIDVPSLFSARNRLKRILDLRWGLEDSMTVKLLDSWIPEYYRNFQGPYSDTDFDSYVHVRSPSDVRNPVKGTWEHKRAIYRPRRYRAKSFLFRKLMHDLRPAQPDPPYIRGRKLMGCGSRFTVIVRNGETVGETTSAVWNWQADYTDALPVV